MLPAFNVSHQLFSAYNRKHVVCAFLAYGLGETEHRHKIVISGRISVHQMKGVSKQRGFEISLSRGCNQDEFWMETQIYNFLLFQKVAKRKKDGSYADGGSEVAKDGRFAIIGPIGRSSEGRQGGTSCLKALSFPPFQSSSHLSVLRNALTLCFKPSQGPWLQLRLPSSPIPWTSSEPECR